MALQTRRQLKSTHLKEEEACKRWRIDSGKMEGEGELLP